MTEPTTTKEPLADLQFLRSACVDLLAACQDALIATTEEGRHSVCGSCGGDLSDHLLAPEHTSWCWVPKVRAAVAKATSGGQ